MSGGEEEDAPIIRLVEAGTRRVLARIRGTGGLLLAEPCREGCTPPEGKHQGRRAFAVKRSSVRAGGSEVDADDLAVGPHQPAGLLAPEVHSP